MHDPDDLIHRRPAVFPGRGDLRQIVLFLVVAFLVGWVVIQISATGTPAHGFLYGRPEGSGAGELPVLCSLGAIVKGGWFGVGIGQASTKLTGLPFAATDSIFAVIVEELGLFGAAALIGLYGCSCGAA